MGFSGFVAGAEALTTITLGPLIDLSSDIIFNACHGHLKGLPVSCLVSALPYQIFSPQWSRKEQSWRFLIYQTAFPEDGYSPL